MQSAATPRAMPAVGASPNRSHALGIAFAVAAVGVIAAAIVIAKSHHKRPPQGITTDLAMGSASPPPAPPPPDAAPPPPLDAAPPPLDAAAPMTAPHPTPPHAPAKTPQPQPQPPPSNAQPEQPYPQQAAQPQVDACQTSCALAAKCDLASVPMCLAECHRNTLVNFCAQKSNANCTGYASCMIEGTCGPTFGGTGTCNAALTCQAQHCKLGDNTCGCSCARGTSLLHALALFAADACLIACGVDQNCVRQNCPNAIPRCTSQ
jgi:hypothetical protein